MTRLRAAIAGMAVLVLVLVASPATASAATADTNLIFMHHSVGSAWLSRGLCAALNASGYHVADTNYGWTGGSGVDYGSYTDTGHWPNWFNDTVMGLVYPWMGLSSGSNTLDPAAGENTIVMFKSCYPNSDVGEYIDDEKAIYNGLLPYFQAHPDKMFVLITPPPMQSISYPLKTRELCNWLTDRDTGWLKDLTTGNVFVFDFYNVLTDPNAHHRLVDGVEVHTVVSGANTLYYDSSGDDHPNAAGDAKATTEFVPLLNAWYQEFLINSGSALSRIQETDPHISYLGTWAKWSSSALSGGSITYTSMTGAAALVSFSGTTFELLASKGPNYGRVSISIDDAPATEVDLYDASYLHKQSIYSRTDLADTAHTATIMCTGLNNDASTGPSVNIDALGVLGALAQAPSPARSQQDDAHFRYVGPWATSSTNWLLSGGTFASVDGPGSAVNLTFDGTYLAWVAKKGPGYGKAKVSLDGGTPVLVDLYSSYDQYKKRVYDTGLLADGRHTVNIYWAGEKNPASSGTKIDVDTVDLFGVPADGSDPAPILWRYQQTDPKLTYIGAWSTGTTWSASGGSFFSTGVTGAAVVVKFTGTSVKLVAKKAPWYGRATITLDGDAQTRDFYSSSQLFKQTVYENPTPLSPGVHTLVIRCDGVKQAASSGVAICIDALDINGYVDATTTRIQETDGSCTTEGVWSTGTTWSASGGSFMSASSTGAKMTVTFSGTYLAWVGKTCPWYGKARVTLDGVAATGLVDLYSASTIWKKRVYETGLLTDGSHTLVIEWTGNKNSRSTGTAIGVDAFDVLGPLTP